MPHALSRGPLRSVRHRHRVRRQHFPHRLLHDALPGREALGEAVQQRHGAPDQREVVRNIVREKKAAEALDLWARDIRARAYVEIREEPQL